jgi:hypothetical protein
MVGFAPKTARSTNGEYEAVNEKDKRDFAYLLGQRLSVRQAARGCGVGRSTVKEYLERAEKAGLTWPLPEELDDARLESLLFPSAVPLTVERRNMLPFDYIHKELSRKHVTL